jgi:hypothetical protein
MFSFGQGKKKRPTTPRDGWKPEQHGDLNALNLVCLVFPFPPPR